MRLLLAEDDELLRESLYQMLREAGYAVDAVADGEEAQFMGQEEPYDLVILDLGLPKRSGLQVLSHWRSHKRAMPVLILTARGAWHEKVEGFKCGADDYLVKPFHPQELLARVQALIRRSHNVVSHLQVGPLQLNEERQQVLLDGQPIDLTGAEFRILRYFMLHPGKIVPASELTEHTYDFNADRDSNVIEVYVSRLRRKIGKEFITTRRGQGYQFNSPA